MLFCYYLDVDEFLGASLNFTQTLSSRFYVQQFTLIFIVIRNNEPRKTKAANGI